MRRTQSLRHSHRASVSAHPITPTDELGILNEDETPEEALRREILEKDRENDKLRAQVTALQSQLAQRPSTETVYELQREHKNLELLLTGTNRENERAMIELEKGKAREKMLEKELERLLGPNWQTSLEVDINSINSPIPRMGSAMSHHRPAASMQGPRNEPAPRPQPQAEQLAYVEQVKLLVLGMDQRLQAREEELLSRVKQAEDEAKKWEERGRGMIETGA